MPVYNPVIKSGKFRVWLGDKSAEIRAIDSAEAKFKFCKRFSISFNENVAKIQTAVIEPVIRKYDDLSDSTRLHK